MRVLAAIVIALLNLAPPCRAADWPAYRHDISRSSATAESLTFPLQQKWVYRATQAPRPAWPETYHLLNRLDFDYAPHPVTGGGMVYFGSTADDTVRALDEATGELRWTFVTGGPVRLAPQYVDGRLYLGSDDGLVYCLDAATGKPLWQFRAAPYDDMLIGNQRVISRWPVRTGVLVMDDTVYFAAGMWNSDGIHLCALNARSGSLLWRNDNAGYLGIFFKGSQTNRTEPVTSLMKNTTHEGEFGSTGINPQGALLAYDDSLIVPTGTSFPWRFDRINGQNKPWDNRVSPAPGVGGAAGGTWNCIDRGILYTLTRYRTDTTALQNINVSSRVQAHAIRLILPNLNVQPPGVGSRYRPKDYTHGKGKASVLVSNGKGYARAAYSLVLADKTLLLGLDGLVVAQEADTERELWRAPVDGIAREIAVANGRVLVSTQSGRLYAFGPNEAKGGQPAIQPAPNPAPGAAPPKQTEGIAGPLAEALRAGGMDRGYALVLGDTDARLSLSLVAATRLHVVNLQASPAEVEALRDRLVATTSLYGSRLHVLPLGPGDHLPFARYFANAVILAGPVEKLPPPELYRVLRPYGGMLLAPGLKPAEALALFKATGAPGGDFPAADAAGATRALTRGPIEGARDWNARIADRAAGGPMRVLWFGGPDTQQTQSFRQSTNPPVVVSGRYLNLAESMLTCVDAYNGTVQWSRRITRQNRDLIGIDGVVHHLREPRAGADAPDDSPPDAPGDVKPAADPHNVNDADMVSMDEKADVGGGRALRILDASTAFLVLGKAPNETWVELDINTGAQRRLYTQWEPATKVSLEKPRSWPLRVDDKHTGEVGLASDAQGLTVTLATLDAEVTALDAWDLFMDFRPLDRRAGLLEPGAFHLRVSPPREPGDAPAARLVNGDAAPAHSISGERKPGGTAVTIRFAWADIEKFAGSRPASFGFAATLNSHDGGQGEPIRRRHLFADWSSDALNLGWANVFLGPAPADVAPPAIVSPLTANPGRKLRDPVQAERNAPAELDEEVSFGLRVHPLTGELEPKIFRSGTGGCGGPHFTATSRYGRATGNLGLYDFADDSGLRNLSGIKAGCSTAITAALGLLIVSPEGGHCVCTFPFATTVTLAPADRRLNEDWAIYHDRPVDTLVRQAAINLGAFGDRRDANGSLWLGFPRSPDRAMNFSQTPTRLTQPATAPAGLWLRYSPAAMPVPLTIDYLDNASASHDAEDLTPFGGMWATWMPNRLNKPFGPYRYNTDVVPIAKTDRPWIYGSGVRGLKSATLRLDFRTPVVAASSANGNKPSIDGKLDEPFWAGAPTLTLPSTRTTVHLRHDAQTLYVAMNRPSIINRLAQISPWRKTTKGEDAPIWEDDSCELFFSDARSGRVVHLGVSASGARFDALAEGAQAAENPAWNGAWTSAVRGDDSTLNFELAIPLATLTAAGLDKDHLSVNLQMSQRDVSGEVYMYPAGMGREINPKETTGEALSYLGPEGRAHCRNFVPLGLGQEPVVPERGFVLRLHFAELDGAGPGQRVFDVKVQGKTVLENLDVAREVGAGAALVKEIAGIKARDELKIEFVSKAEKPEVKSVPMLSGIELREEGFTPPKPPPVTPREAKAAALKR